MAEYSSIVRFLEAERERYILEAAELERRLKLVHNQMNALDALIRGYATEEQMYSTSRGLSNFHSTQVFLQQNLTQEDDLDIEDEYFEQQNIVEENTAINNSAIGEQTGATSQSEPTITEDKSGDSSTNEIDISDIPKLATKRKPTSLPLLPEFLEYSVQNAILILMRRRPDLHLHSDAIVRDIYGDLPPEPLKVAKMNVSKALSTGCQLGMWYRVLRATGVYTLHYEKGVTARAK
ncbi:hypothetical protein IQ244_25440 [Nostoc sp. LEGE 06077]|uniref:hypothetical protein n=1 Tax=Nostoc sp. LEGE 06077 TaxID=915325 RepID=UPI001882EB60|nr:hypothetical protein [Nostoc sp. LEGE 06077]MBE9209778.1 hypothetical protein [Nostoc sp. LEGE 06077]